MSEEKIVRYLKYVPLAIAAGYFVFLIASWQVYLRSQQRNREYFEAQVDQWVLSHKGRESGDERG